MNKTKFTPGPWRYDTSGNISNKVVAYSGKKFNDLDTGERSVALIMHCEPTGDYYQERENLEANAHLIAAAPEIYKALDDLTKWVQALNDWAGGTKLDPPIEAANAALLKAEGTNT